MSDRLFVSTRKGLFSFLRGPAGWALERVSFLGDAVSLSLHDRRDGALLRFPSGAYAQMNCSKIRPLDRREVLRAMSKGLSGR